MPPVGPMTPAITVAGRPLSAQWLDALTSARIDLALGLSGRAVLRFVDGGFGLSSSSVFAMGATVVLKAGTDDLMTGEVTGVALEQSSRQTPELVVTIDDKACRLAGRTQNRTFLNHTYGQLMTKIGQEAGLTVSYSGPATSHAYQLQAGSNLAFLNALCARAGLVWWVQGASTLKVVAAGTPGTTVDVELGTPALTGFSVRATSAGPESVEVRGWNPDQQAAVTGTHTTKRGAESTFVAAAAGRASSARGSTAVSVASPPPIDAGEAASMATAMFAEASSAAVVAKGSGAVNAALALSGQVKVVNAGPASGSYVLTRIEHVYHRNGFLTHFTAGPVRPATLVDLLGPPAPETGLSIPGVIAAVVTNVADPDSKGRVRVRFTAVSDQVESAWARLATIGAGRSRGMLFFPEVNDEVLVAFEQGDTRRPVVLGGLYSSTNTLPSTDSIDQDKVKFRRITSRLGHVVELADGDAPADQHIALILNGKKNSIRVGADKLDIVTDGTPIKVTNGQATVELAQNGDVSLAGNNIELKAKAEIKITANSKVTVKGTAGTAIGGAQVQIKSDATGSVEAGGPLTIKGATVAIN